MKTAGIFLGMGFLALAAGCSRPGNGAAGGSAGAWTYQSAEPDFSVTLPSGGWKQLTKKRFLVDFWGRTAAGSPMLAGVRSAKRETRQQFQSSLAEFGANANKGGEYLLKPTTHQGQTDAGNPYIYTAMCEKGEAGVQFVYVATAAVWLADKGLTVTTLFEGQGRMSSNTLRAVEYAEFEATARSICLSPQ